MPLVELEDRKQQKFTVPKSVDDQVVAYCEWAKSRKSLFYEEAAKRLLEQDEEWVAHCKEKHEREEAKAKEGSSGTAA